VLVRRALAKTDLLLKALLNRLRPDSNSEWGRIRRGGYIIKWFIGDHPPRHVHIERENGELIGRLDLERMTGMEGCRIENC
jgi:hypothetical protein